MYSLKRLQKSGSMQQYTKIKDPLPDFPTTPSTPSKESKNDCASLAQI
jgi:hypothetical protein